MKTPLGFRYAGVHAGLKPVRRDVALIASEVPAAAAGCFTTNLAKATLVNDQFVDVTIRLNADNTLDVIHNGTTYFDHVPLDAQGYTPMAGASFLFGARTGGEFERTVLDNVAIIVNGQATAPPAQAQFTSITKQGNNIVITWTGSGTLQESSSLTAPATWTPVAGNPSGTYTTPAATTENKFYRIATSQ